MLRWPSDQICAVTPPSLAKGLSAGNAAVGIQAQYLAKIAAHILRGIEFLALTRPDEEIFPIGRKDEAVRIMALSDHFRILFPDDLEPFECRGGALFELGLADDRAIGIARAGFGPAQIDDAAGRKIGCDDNVAKAPLTPIGHVGNARDVERRPIFLPEFELAASFGDQRSACAGDEYHRPRLIEAGNILDG